MKNIYKYLFIFSVLFGFAFSAFSAPSSNIFRTILPEADSTYDIGSNLVRWANGYFDNLDTATITISGSSVGNITIKKADPCLIYDVTTATDTDFWTGVQDDAGGDDDDTFQIGDGTTCGTNPWLTIDTSGNATIGTSLTVPTVLGGTATTSDLNLKTTSGIGAAGADMHFLVGNNGATEAMTILNNGNVGIGTTAPGAALHLGGASPSLYLGVSTGGGRGSLSTFDVSSLRKLVLDGADADSQIIFYNAPTVGTLTTTAYSSRGINFVGYDGNSNEYGARIGFAPATNWADGSSPAVITFFTVPSGSTTLNERMRIDSTGNVGIGTTSPGSILALGGTAARIFGMDRNTTAATAGQGFTISSGGAIAGTADLAGGDLTIKSGTSTGTGTSALRFFTATAGVTGTADNAPTEKMTILGSGNVGIGTANPLRPLQIGDTSGYINLGGVPTFNGSGGIFMINSSTLKNWFIGHNQAIAGAFEIGRTTTAGGSTYTTPDFLISSSGNVGIGTTSPLLKLDVAGSGRFTGAATSVLTGSIDATASTAVVGVGTLFTTELVVGDRITVTGETRTVTAITDNTNLTVDTAFTDTANDTTPDKLAAILVGRNSASAVNFVVNDLGWVGIGTTSPGTIPLEVKGTGTGAIVAKFTDVNTTGCTLATGGTIACSSDVRLKKNIENISYGLTTLMSLRPVLYNWNYESDDAVKNLGFIAQEVEALVPKLISTDTDGMKSLNTTGMIPILTKAIQEQQVQIKKLELRIKILEQKIKNEK